MNSIDAEPGIDTMAEKRTDLGSPCPVYIRPLPYTGFLQLYDNKKTRENYRTVLHLYLRFVSSADAGKSDESTYDSMAELYLNELKRGRNPVPDIIQFANRITKTHAASTVRLAVMTVSLWFKYNGVPLDREVKKRLIKTVPKTASARHETELTRPLFRNIYSQMTKEWARTLLLVLLSTGMHLGEALSLRESDIIRTAAGTEIHIRAETTMANRGRTVYLTKEAAASLETYLAGEKRKEKETAEKEMLIESGTDELPRLNKRQKVRKEKAGCIFPYSAAAAERQMRLAADRAGYGKCGNTPRSVHWHMTRKWFISRVSHYITKEKVEILTGHEGYYMNNAYLRVTEGQLYNAFRKVERHLTLFPEKENILRKRENPDEDR